MGRSEKKHGIACKGAWLPVPLEFLRSRACAELSPHAAKLLFDVLALLGPNATRNGDLSLSPKAMRVRGWSGRETLNAAVRELIDNGLLIQTRQGSRLDCSLFACTLYPLDCDLKKLDVGPGSYRLTDYMGTGATLANPPTEGKPATWRRARKTQTVAPPRDEAGGERPTTGQTASPKSSKSAKTSRHGTKPPVFEGASVPPRVTYLDLPSVPALEHRPTHQINQINQGHPPAEPAAIPRVGVRSVCVRCSDTSHPSPINKETP